MAHRQRPQENMQCFYIHLYFGDFLGKFVIATILFTYIEHPLFVEYLHSQFSSSLGVVTSAFRLRNETFTEIGRMSPQLPEVGFMSDLLLYVVIIINIYTWDVQ